MTANPFRFCRISPSFGVSLHSRYAPSLRGFVSVALRIGSAKYSEVLHAASPFMFVTRSLLLCCLGVLTCNVLNAQVNPAASPTSGPAVAPQEKAVAPSITFNSVHVEGPYIAMTFDDGPSAKLTPKLLDLLAAHHMKVTFFVVGQCVAENPEIVKRALREGHEIANHSWSHPNLGKMSDDAVRHELQKTDDAIKAATGVRPTLMRPPYGSLTARQKNWIHDEFGYRIIIWDVDPLDWKRPGPSVVRERILRETHPGSIILAHDIHPPTIEAMPSTFDELEAKGFKFVTVSELLSMSKPLPPKPAPTTTMVPRKQPPTDASPIPTTAPAEPADAPAGTPHE
ncbi:MAG: polysaccharide deacetylase family protein [Chthoniobacterales bacterium]